MSNNWQPIETAPKDGTDILVYVHKTTEQFVAYWHETYEVWLYAFVPNGPGIYCNPTHWQPLPEAPEVTE